MELVFGLIFILLVVGLAIIITQRCKKDSFSNISLKILPISFAIPEKMFMDPHLPKKNKFSPMVPGDQSTYIYDTEDKYYKQYNESKFGITKSKGGHDCLRHYEIIAAGAIPYYKDIDEIPLNTMHNFPRDIVKRAMANEDNDTIYKE